MISKIISENVLTIGCSYKHPKGGVAHVLNSYSRYVFSKFNFVATTTSGGKLKKSLCFLEALAVFVFRCMSSKIRIVHVHGASYNSFYRKKIFINTAKFFGKKVVYHIHGGGFCDFYNVNKNVVRKVLTRVDVVIVLSDSWKNFFENEVGCKRVEVVPNIVPYHEENKKGENLPLKCVFLGTINKNKGIYDMVDVVCEHQNELRGYLTLYIGGSGEQDKMLSLINRYGIADIIKYVGFVSGDKKTLLLQSSDFYILPSYVEGLPISILEAMSYSLPIISTSVGGIPEIVENGVNGILIQPGEKDALYKAIMQLLFDAVLRKNMGEASYKKVKPYFPENVNRKLESLYTELLKK